MNERIRELICKADQYSISNVDRGRDSEFFHTIAMNKLTELIVRECINEVHAADVGDLEAQGYYLDKVAEHLEKHFGVQE